MISPQSVQDIMCQLDIAWKTLEMSIQSIGITQSLLTNVQVSYIKQSAFSQQLTDAELKLSALRSTGTPLFSVMDALFKHIEKRQGSIGAYFTANGIKVPKSMSDLAKIIGYTIPYVNAEDLVC